MEENGITATLEYIIFENKTNHYVVASFSETETYHVFTATGRIENPQEDQEYELTGKYVKHPRYGSQFQIQSAKLCLPKHEEAIVHFLCSEHFPTIGKKTAQTIYDTLGEQCLEQIQEDVSCLKQIPKLNDKKIDIIKKGIQDYTGFNETYVELVKYGLSDRQIQLLENNYDDIHSVLEEDCFQPFYEIHGFGYKTACKLADGMQMNGQDTRRLDAALYEMCRQLAMESGNTYITYPMLYDRFMHISQESFEEGLARLQAKKYIEIENMKIYPFTLYDDEMTIAEEIKVHQFELEPIDDEELEDKIRETEFALNIQYDEVQKEAIRTFFHTSFFILNGGPGTGKTTAVKGILSIAKSFYPDSTIQLCAPTGRASKRLAQLSMNDSKTIHSLLKWNLEDNTFAQNEENPLDVDFLIVDEFSMVDVHLFAQLLKALPYHCRILLIGDEDQLESVAPGKVLSDLIQSQICPVIHLEKIFRQSDGSGIVELAKEIRQEEVCSYEDGVVFIEKESPEVLETILTLIQGMELDSMQILAPMYKGSVGIDAINSTLQMTLNPANGSKKQIKVGTTYFREEDKVMLLKNMPEEDVYNGDIGYILKINEKENTITVDFNDQIVDFTKDFLYYLTHAYCISVHKSQGSEYDYVFCIVDKNSRYMLDKRLLYTAISRAKKKLYIIGDRHLFETQVRLKQRRIRQTTLVDRLKKEEPSLRF